MQGYEIAALFIGQEVEVIDCQKARPSAWGGSPLPMRWVSVKRDAPGLKPLFDLLAESGIEAGNVRLCAPDPANLDPRPGEVIVGVNPDGTDGAPPSDGVAKRWYITRIAFG